MNSASQPNLTKSHYRRGPVAGRGDNLLLTRIVSVDSLAPQLILDLEGDVKLAVRQVTVCADDG
jgi:hypothetical protein